MKSLLLLPLLFLSLLVTAQQQPAQPMYDVAPQYPGGMEAVQRYLSENVRYPEAARNAGIEGRVEVKYVVSAQGMVTEVSILKPAHPLLDREALRVVKAMPNWKPGTLNGKKVPVLMAMPIIFELEGPHPRKP